MPVQCHPPLQDVGAITHLGISYEDKVKLSGRAVGGVGVGVGTVAVDVLQISGSRYSLWRLQSSQVESSIKDQEYE